MASGDEDLDSHCRYRLPTICRRRLNDLFQGGNEQTVWFNMIKPSQSSAIFKGRRGVEFF